ncbi:hypothetical protein B0T14DRAFT_39564 [Immersiella caudata]|uniref:RING-type E3 ubiquitin transferase n=1 Tax=Immersiella caudata TaxID=314043 RepID=A0AA39XFA4_9PEZI|nr:hypothetical protein B0T14DRAFT_39564 [Immersiella caudata]
MPPSSQARPSGLPGGSTTIAIVLVLIIPSVFLVGICVARRMPWFQPIRQRLRAVTPRFTRQAGAAGPESLRKLPVVKYDEKIFNADPESGKSDVEEGTVDFHGKQRLRNLTVSFSRLGWFMPSTNQQRKDSGETNAMPCSETSATRLAMQSCAICTEDFHQGTKVRKLPCGHFFHLRCIDPWLVNFAATCPLCRIDLSVKEATGRVSKPRPAAATAPSITALTPSALSPPTLSPTVLPPLVPPTHETSIPSTSSPSALHNDEPHATSEAAVPATAPPAA